MRIVSVILLLCLVSCAPVTRSAGSKLPSLSQGKTCEVPRRLRFSYAAQDRKGAAYPGARARLTPKNEAALLRDTHEVRYFLTQLTSDSGRTFISEALPRRDQYLPLIERVFTDYGIPPELANLAFLESGFRPTASNGSGAAGLWQFMKGTAREYDLHVSLFRDERKDVFKSTVAAARYLLVLHNRFDDWLLAVAAYNTGPGLIDRAIETAGTRDFFELSRRGAINKDISAFVAKFIAISMITRNPPVYGFEGMKSSG